MRSPSGAEDIGSADVGVDVRKGAGSGIAAVGRAEGKVGVIPNVDTGTEVLTPQSDSRIVIRITITDRFA